MLCGNSGSISHSTSHQKQNNMNFCMMTGFRAEDGNILSAAAHGCLQASLW
jgi:hypothetical protein